jgi:predicted ABC-type sugar transport system permease subunit
VGAVPTSRKVNNKALSSDVVITEGDIIPQVTAITSTLEAGKSYFFSPSAALNIAILTSAPTGLSHWHFVVRMTTAVNITWGSLDIKWNSDLPTYAVNKTYEFSIIKCGSYYYGAWTSYTN